MTNSCGHHNLMDEEAGQEICLQEEVEDAEDQHHHRRDLLAQQQDIEL